MKTMMTLLVLFSAIVGVIGFTTIFPALSPSPRFAVQQNLTRRTSSPMGRAYLAARIAKTLRHQGYPTKWTIENDVEGGSPAIILQCPRFSPRAIAGFIDRGILADLYFESFARVDFANGSRTWSHELNESHLREHSQGKLYLFASDLTDAEFDQVNKQFFESRTRPASPELSNPTPSKAHRDPQKPGNLPQHPG